MHFSDDEEARALPLCRGVFTSWSAYVLTPVTSMAGWTALLAHMVLYLEVLIMIRILELGGKMTTETQEKIESSEEYASLVVNDALEEFAMKIDAKTVAVWKLWQLERIELRGDLSDQGDVETVEDSRGARRSATEARAEAAAQPQVIQVRIATLRPALDHKVKPPANRYTSQKYLVCAESERHP